MQNLMDRLNVIEAKLDRILHTFPHIFPHTSGTKGALRSILGVEADSLLVGWNEIARFARKHPKTLQRYARRMAFPSYRFGRSTVSHRELIFRWFFVVQELKRERKNREASG